MLTAAVHSPFGYSQLNFRHHLQPTCWFLDSFFIFHRVGLIHDPVQESGHELTGWVNDTVFYNPLKS